MRQPCDPGSGRLPLLLAVAAAVVLGLVATWWLLRDDAAEGPDTPAPATSAGSATDAAAGSAGPSAGTSASPTDRVVGRTTAGMNLQSALSAARADTCQTCVDLTYARTAAEVSAARGLVEVGVSDSQGGGYVSLWGYTGDDWQPLMGYQNTVPLPNRLPTTVWICAATDATDIRSGPGEQYPAVAQVSTTTPAEATFMVLTEAESREAADGPVPGKGWLEVDGKGIDGWVSTDRVDANEDCSVWRAYQDLPR